MRTVTVRKSELIDKLTANRATHRAQFEAALAGWHQAVLAELQSAVEDALAGRQYRTFFQLPQPVDHTEEYDRALAMLEMEVGDTVELTENEFAELVMDNWRWKPDFMTTNASYAPS